MTLFLKYKFAKPILLSIVIFTGMVTCKNSEELIPDPTVSITASASQIKYNELVIITWNSTNAISCKLNEENVSNSGSVSRSLLQTTIFTIIAQGENNTASSSIVVTVIMPDAPVISITAPSEQIPYGETYTIPVKANIIGVLNSDGVKVNGTVLMTETFTTPKLYANTTYTIEATGPGGTTTKTFEIKVGDWTTSPQGLLTGPNKTWKQGYGLRIAKESRNNISTDYKWKDWPEDTDTKDWETFYSLDGYKFWYNDKGSQVDDKLKYDFYTENDTLKIKVFTGSKNPVFCVEKISPDSLVVITKKITHDQIYGDIPSFSRIRYSREKKE